MKKKPLAVISIMAAMSLLAACSPTITSSSSSSVDPLVTAGEAALKMLNFEMQAQAGMTSRSFDLFPVIDYSDQYTFNVNYSITQVTTYEGASATLTEDTDPDLVSPDYSCSLVAPFKDPSNSASWVVFSLTATVIYQGTPAVVNNAYYGYTGQEVASASYNLRVDPISVTALNKVPSLAATTPLMTFGYYTGKYDNSTDYYWIGDGASGLTAYRPTISSGDLKAGNFVKITGTYSPYGGLPELGSGCVITKSSVSEATSYGLSVTKPETLQWDGSYAFKTTDSSREMTCSGAAKATPIFNAAKKTYSLTLVVGAADLSVFIDANKMSAARLTGWDNVKANDSLSLSGWLSVSSNVYQLINALIVTA